MSLERVFPALAAILFVINVGPALAQDVNPGEVLERPKIYSPYVERTASDANLAEGVYWGDTHLHTSYSTDSGMMGNTLGPSRDC